MKKVVSILFIISLLYSCTKEEAESTADFTEYFELVKMTESWSGIETIGNQMEWRETYVLNTKEFTFSKSRYFDETLTEGKGTYTYKSVDNQKYIEFIFNEDSDIVSNCYGNLIETMNVFDNGYTLVSTWEACDGPRLEYRKGFEFCGTPSN